MPNWVKLPGEIERLDRAEADDVLLTMAREALALAQSDQQRIEEQRYPSSTVPKSIVLHVATRRVLAAERMLRLVKEEIGRRGG